MLSVMLDRNVQLFLFPISLLVCFQSLFLQMTVSYELGKMNISSRLFNSNFAFRIDHSFWSKLGGHINIHKKRNHL